MSRTEVLSGASSRAANGLFPCSTTAWFCMPRQKRTALSISWVFKSLSDLELDLGFSGGATVWGAVMTGGEYGCRSADREPAVGGRSGVMLGETGA